MIKNAKRLTRYTFLVLSAVNLISFGITLLSLFFSNIDAVTYVTTFALRIIEDLVLAASAAVVLLNLVLLSKKSWLLSALALSLSRLFYLLPYDYLYFEFGGYDTGESLLLSLIQGALEVALTFGILLFLTFAASITVSRRTPCDEEGESELLKRKIFDFSDRYAVGVFTMSIILFLYNLIGEIADTVSYLVDYAGTYRAGEILYIVLSYVFILLSLLAVHSVAFVTKRIGARFIISGAENDAQ